MTGSPENRWYKQVLVVRSDLKMGKGKIAVQCSHAAVSASEEARKSSLDWWGIWMHEGQSKVAVKVSGLSQILDYERRSRENGLPFYVVSEMVRTQARPGTVTCFGNAP